MLEHLKIRIKLEQNYSKNVSNVIILVSLTRPAGRILESYLVDPKTWSKISFSFCRKLTESLNLELVLNGKRRRRKQCAYNKLNNKIAFLRLKDHSYHEEAEEAPEVEGMQSPATTHPDTLNGFSCICVCRREFLLFIFVAGGTFPKKIVIFFLFTKKIYYKKINSSLSHHPLRRSFLPSFRTNRYDVFSSFALLNCIAFS